MLCNHYFQASLKSPKKIAKAFRLSGVSKNLVFKSARVVQRIRTSSLGEFGENIFAESAIGEAKISY